MKKVLAVLLVIAFVAVLSPKVQAQTAGTANRGNQPTERTFGKGERILGYDAPPPGPLNEEQIRRQQAAVQYPGNASLDYRGVVFDNFNAARSFGEEIVVDFGSSGIWVRDSIWHQISNQNPYWMISGTIGGTTTDAELIAAFPYYGVWVWEYNGYPGTWTQISGFSSTGGAFTVNDDDDDGLELYVDFASAGLWRHEFHNGRSWLKVSGLDLTTGLQMNTIRGTTNEACALFPTQGVWRLWFSGTPQYDQLTGTVTEEDDHVSARFTGGSVDDLVIDFDTLGLWMYVGETREWHQVDTDLVQAVRAVNFGGDANVELMIMHPFSPGPTGLWMWSYGTWPGSLTKLHSWTLDYHGFVEPLDIDGDTETSGDQEIAVDFGSNGLWLYDNTDQSWTQISTANPTFIVAGDYWDDGYDSTLVVGFSSYGLWRYSAKTGTWSQLSSILPDGNG